MKGENGVPETPDWVPQSRDCRPETCVCENAQHAALIHGCAISLGDNIEPGTE